eukprot:UN17485
MLLTIGATLKSGYTDVLWTFLRRWLQNTSKIGHPQRFRQDCRRRPVVAIRSKVFEKYRCNHIDLSLLKVAKSYNGISIYR